MKEIEQIPLSQLVTIIVAPREKHSTLPDSLDYMEDTWNMDFNRNRVLHRWIKNHRRRPFRNYPHAIGKLLPHRLEALYLRRRFGYEV